MEVKVSEGGQSTLFGNINNTYNISSPAVVTPVFDCSKYNLFVTEAGVFSSGGSTLAFTVAPEAALEKSCTSESLRKEFARLSESQIAKLKTFPSIFVEVNQEDSNAGASQTAFFGFVKEIRVDASAIQLEAVATKRFPQQLLNEHLTELLLVPGPRRNELNEPHWALKGTNLFEALKSFGIDISQEF